jgi:hypothetical protein
VLVDLFEIGVDRPEGDYRPSSERFRRRSI